MQRLIDILRVTAMTSLIELLTIYPPKIYLVSWVPRVLTQVAFFTIFVTFVSGPEALSFALIGNTCYMLAMSVIGTVTASVTWERNFGTLPLLIAAPSNPLLVFSGRNVGMALNGLITGMVGVYLVAPLLGMALSLRAALLLFPALLSILIASYGLALFLGSVALPTRGYHNVLSNTFSFVILVICGVNYPLSALPASFQAAAALMPLTRGLHAARLILDGGRLEEALWLMGGEVLVGIIYTVLAQLCLGWFLHRAREKGTLEYH